MKKISIASILVICALLQFACGGSLESAEPASSGGYRVVNLTANSPEYGAAAIDDTLGNSWGIAIRPAGLGGHFWVTNANTGISTEYVGDVGGVPLFQDELKTVSIPAPAGAASGSVGQPTGIVFNQSSEFVVTQADPNGAITAAAKFIFVTNDGTITAWTERKRSDGGFDRPAEAEIVVDNFAAGHDYFGAGISNLSSGNHLYVADFGAEPRVRVFNASFEEVSDSFPFDNPFSSRLYVPFNVQVLGSSVFVSYAKGSGEGGEESAGEGKGRLVEYDLNGNLLQIWIDNDLLNAPWGVVYAPHNFGEFSGFLLVSNFGDGRIVAFDPATHEAIDSLRDESGAVIAVEGIWGILFGNGASLGEANHLYFAAGPKDETDGLFGKIVPPGLP